MSQSSNWRTDQEVDVLAMSTDFKSGEAESAGRAVWYVTEAFGEFGGVEKKRPKQSSGQVVYSDFDVSFALLGLEIETDFKEQLYPLAGEIRHFA